MDEMGEYHTTLQQLAREEDPAERERLASILASQMEARENTLANRTQVTVWDGQIRAEEKIDRLQEQVGNSNILLSTFLEKFPPQIEQSLGEVKNALGVLNSGFSAFGEKVNQLEIVQGEHGTRLDKHDERLGKVEARLDDHAGRIVRIERIMRISAEESGAAGAAADVIDTWEDSHPAPDFTNESAKR